MLGKLPSISGSKNPVNPMMSNQLSPIANNMNTMQQLQQQLAPNEANTTLILEEEFDPNYKPTQAVNFKEILDYAQYLGMHPVNDQKYFFLAAEGLVAPLPEKWKPCQSRTGEIYYRNFETQEKLTEHPCDRIYRLKFTQLKQQETLQRQQELTSKQDYNQTPLIQNKDQNQILTEHTHTLQSVLPNTARTNQEEEQNYNDDQLITPMMNQNQQEYYNEGLINAIEYQGKQLTQVELAVIIKEKADKMKNKSEAKLERMLIDKEQMLIKAEHQFQNQLKDHAKKLELKFQKETLAFEKELLELKSEQAQFLRQSTTKIKHETQHNMKEDYSEDEILLQEEHSDKVSRLQEEMYNDFLSQVEDLQDNLQQKWRNDLEKQSDKKDSFIKKYGKIESNKVKNKRKKYFQSLNYEKEEIQNNFNDLFNKIQENQISKQQEEITSRKNRNKIVINEQLEVSSHSLFFNLIFIKDIKNGISITEKNERERKNQISNLHFKKMELKKKKLYDRTQNEIKRYNIAQKKIIEKVLKKQTEKMKTQKEQQITSSIRMERNKFVRNEEADKIQYEDKVKGQYNLRKQKMIIFQNDYLTRRSDQIAEQPQFLPYGNIKNQLNLLQKVIFKKESTQRDLLGQIYKEDLIQSELKIDVQQKKHKLNLLKKEKTQKDYQNDNYMYLENQTVELEGKLKRLQDQLRKLKTVQRKDILIPPDFQKDQKEIQQFTEATNLKQSQQFKSILFDVSILQTELLKKPVKYPSIQSFKRSTYSPMKQYNQKMLTKMKKPEKKQSKIDMMIQRESQIIEQEKIDLTKNKKILKTKQLNLKQSQFNFELDQNTIKQSVLLLPANEYAYQSERVQTKKGFLNQQIRKMNTDIYKLREKQRLLERKERTIDKLKQIVDTNRNKVNTPNLQSFYFFYNILILIESIRDLLSQYNQLKKKKDNQDLFQSKDITPNTIDITTTARDVFFTQQKRIKSNQMKLAKLAFNNSRQNVEQQEAPINLLQQGPFPFTARQNTRSFENTNYAPLTSRTGQRLQQRQQLEQQQEIDSMFRNHSNGYLRLKHELNQDMYYKY